MLKKKPAIYIIVLNLAIVMALFLSCAGKTTSDLSKESLIPRPVSVTPSGEYFKLKPGTDIILREDNNELKLTGQYLADKLKLSTGFKIDVRITDSDRKSVV